MTELVGSRDLFKAFAPYFFILIQFSFHIVLFEPVMDFRMFVGTWNVGGISPPEDLNLRDWLQTPASAADIYVLGYVHFLLSLSLSMLNKTSIHNLYQ